MWVRILSSATVIASPSDSEWRSNLLINRGLLRAGSRYEREKHSLYSTSSTRNDGKRDYIDTIIREAFNAERIIKYSVMFSAVTMPTSCPLWVTGKAGMPDS